MNYTTGVRFGGGRSIAFGATAAAIVPRVTLENDRSETSLG